MNKQLNQKPSLAIVGIVGLPANYGGWETLAENILGSLLSDFEVTVYCSSKRYKNKSKSYNGAIIDYIKYDANGVQSIIYDAIGCWRSRNHDVVLILGVSGCIFLPFFRLFSKAQYCLNIDGLEWKRAKWSKPIQFFLRMSEKIGVSYSQNLIADNRVIQEYIKNNYNKKSKLIAYGGDWIKYTEEFENYTDHHETPSGDYAFTVCRIEPENNIHIILEAFSVIDFPIIIFGNWNASEYGKNLYKKYNNLNNIYLYQPLYCRKSLDKYRAHCSIYIHGHSAGGTNPSLVEAMWMQRSIICYDVNFNRETTENKALYFSDKFSLKKIVTHTINNNYSNGANMKEIADRRYTWSIVGEEYKKLLKGMLSL